MRASAKNPGRTSKFYTGTPVYPFGHGMTYTTFSYQTIDAAAEYSIKDMIDNARLDDKIQDVTWTINITNTGKVVSDVVILGFLLSNGTIEGVTPPLKELFDFARIHDVSPGTSQVITLGLSYRVLSTIDQDGHAWLIPGKYQLQLNNEVDEQVTVVLKGDPMLIEDFPGAPAPTKLPVIVEYERNKIINTPANRVELSTS